MGWEVKRKVAKGKTENLARSRVMMGRGESKEWLIGRYENVIQIGENAQKLRYLHSEVAPEVAPSLPVW